MRSLADMNYGPVILGYICCIQYVYIHIFIYIYTHKRSPRQGWGCKRKGRLSSAVLNMQSQYDLQRKHKMNLVEAFWIATSTKHCYLQCLMHLEPKMLIFTVFCNTMANKSTGNYSVLTNCMHKTTVNISKFQRFPQKRTQHILYNFICFIQTMSNRTLG